MGHFRLVDWIATFLVLALVASPAVVCVVGGFLPQGRVPGLVAWAARLGLLKGRGASFNTKVLRRWWPSEKVRWAETFGGKVRGFSVQVGVVQKTHWKVGDEWEAREVDHEVGFCLSVRSAYLAIRRFEAPGLKVGTWLTPVHLVGALSTELRDLLEEEGPWRWYGDGRNTLYLAWVGPGEGPLSSDALRDEGLERALWVAECLCASRVLPAPGRKEFVQPRRPRGLLGPATDSDSEWVCPTCGRLLAAEARCADCQIDAIPVSQQRASVLEANVISHNLRVLARNLPPAAEEELLALLQAHRIPAVCFSEPRVVCVFRRDLKTARALRPSSPSPVDGTPGHEDPT